MENHTLRLYAVSLLPLLALSVGCREPSQASDTGDAPRATLAPFPADDPSSWTCEPTRVSDDADAQFCTQYRDTCAAEPGTCKEAVFSTPATILDLADKNVYDAAVRDFMREKKYRELGWVSDQQWRMTGPYVGDFGDGASYGVHPAVRVWYSPSIVKWMCDGRRGEPAEGAMIVKEMRDIGDPEDFEALGIDPEQPCMIVDPDKDPDPSSWTVMIRHPDVAHDGWYWANPAGSGEGNPPILDETAITSDTFWGPGGFGKKTERDPKWFPTGDLFGSDGHLASAVTPYNTFAAYCLNCHASATSHSTFSSLDNVISPGLRYRHFAATPTAGPDVHLSGTEHAEPEASTLAKRVGSTTDAPTDAWGLINPNDTETVPSRFSDFFGDLGPATYAEALPLRLPAQTFDHAMVPPGASKAEFVTSDQCIGCHDATVSNASTPNMLIELPEIDPETKLNRTVNVSPYGEWRSSPMGLAGRDPIFFSQLQSETNNLAAQAECIENTCLHCHGVMGQRQLAADTQKPGTPDKCKDMFALGPPAGVPFGDPFGLATVTTWAEDQGGQAGAETARYGALARDGISCAVCHRISPEGLADEASFTGNFLAADQRTIFGPYADADIAQKPMQHAINYTPKYGLHTSNSDLCGSCHNILLPVFTNAGQPYEFKWEGEKLSHRYEQTTHLEWQNSAFAKPGDGFRSCQGCHMPTTYPGYTGGPSNNPSSLSGTRIANIESDEFAPTTERLADADIELRPRSHYSRHSLHGLNLFLNQMFQQFPILLGIRQIDYMGSLASSLAPSLVAGANSMLAMARDETADIEIAALKIDPVTGSVDFDVRVTNKVGHFLPSGVGFRRVFIEVLVNGPGGAPLWASGRTNELGAILDGTSDKVLSTEYGNDDSTAYQPHFQVISTGAQVQIYQEITTDSADVLTTSFLRRVNEVKDNRLRPAGYDPEYFKTHFDSPYINMLAETLGATKDDPDYTDPSRTGSDMISYRVKLEPADAAKIVDVTVRLHSQSVPPSYLQQRFNDAKVGPGEDDQISRLYYLTSHLRTDGDTPISGWKVFLVSDCKLANGQACP